MATSDQILALASLAHQAGWQDDGAQNKSLAVALSLAVNPTSDPAMVNNNRYGLWQLFTSDITGDPKTVLTAASNADAAFAVWKAHGWSHWPEYRGAAFKSALSEVAKARISPGWTVTNSSGGWTPIQLLNPFLQLFKSAASGAQGAVNSVSGIGGLIGGLFGNLEGVAEGALGMLLGLVLVGFGIWMLAPHRAVI